MNNPCWLKQSQQQCFPIQTESNFHKQTQLVVDYHVQNAAHVAVEKVVVFACLAKFRGWIQCCTMRSDDHFDGQSLDTIAEISLGPFSELQQQGYRICECVSTGRSYQ